VALDCGGCGAVTRLPQHHLRPVWSQSPLHCGHCGEGLRA